MYLIEPIQRIRVISDKRDKSSTHKKCTPSVPTVKFSGILKKAME